ncbi:5-formyltetrahydrofolate cyclo-ligase [Helcobacillus massiliensis]|uniref:5-formyltetrahydrofolate cyclo-ligase n=1 Tax=Helcobacillus massiliensis TaxID=521392 RepID=A0A839QXD8_9MICO|nr:MULTISPECIES: 5-formyltetrahydrofolate cyclo-ligase [Helcobacillus]MBB3022641.1 5-formyltetrahydrofolate cyclo-ligase [Helcobacillus massiliensis]MCG7427590.1 5-formyltetrahydrofolate cyclo-ligase [Helcobacillus sp. ACRRO]MCT1558760.1 5-formyltetrahydrofolate cyclo-ligase [Helcobacillus massiliensis]MCT2037516.1 5-formyltetrahydrofolate cyclo-ligase [Helcobacillus massiliensis]MDK7742378.1 5-formyltetrahydrofolate cyclo-ligase [Helcobacillus massiliensis]
MSNIDDLTARKKALRKEILAARRSAYSTPEGAQRHRDESEALVAHLEGFIDSHLGDLERPLVVAGYSALPTEANPMALLRTLATGGSTVLLPVYHGDVLTWREWDGVSELEASEGAKFGTEPTGEDHGVEGLATADLIITPAVAVDRSGTRIGHGKGYYDRALQHRSTESFVVTAVNPSELLPAGTLPRDEHDYPIRFAATADGIAVLTDDA